MQCEPLLLTTDEAAQVLRLSPAKVKQKIASREIESVLIDSSRRIPMAALVEYVQRLRSEQNGLQAVEAVSAA